MMLEWRYIKIKYYYYYYYYIELSSMRHWERGVSKLLSKFRSDASTGFGILPGNHIVDTSRLLASYNNHIPTHQHSVGVGLHAQLGLSGHLTLSSIITSTK